MKELQLFTGGHPYKIDDLIHLQAGLKETVAAILQGLGISSQSVLPIVINGCKIESSQINNVWTTKIGTGVIYLKGELYNVIESGVSKPANLSYLKITTKITNYDGYSTDPGAEVEYENGNYHDVHIYKEISLVDYVFNQDNSQNISLYPYPLILKDIIAQGSSWGNLQSQTSIVSNNTNLIHKKPASSPAILDEDNFTTLKPNILTTENFASKEPNLVYKNSQFLYDPGINITQFVSSFSIGKEPWTVDEFGRIITYKIDIQGVLPTGHEYVGLGLPSYNFTDYDQNTVSFETIFYNPLGGNLKRYDVPSFRVSFVGQIQDITGLVTGGTEVYGLINDPVGNINQWKYTNGQYMYLKGTENTPSKVAFKFFPINTLMLYPSDAGQGNLWPCGANISFVLNEGHGGLSSPLKYSGTLYITLGA